MGEAEGLRYELLLSMQRNHWRSSNQKRSQREQRLKFQRLSLQETMGRTGKGENTSYAGSVLPLPNTSQPRRSLTKSRTNQNTYIHVLPLATPNDLGSHSCSVTESCCWGKPSPTLTKETNWCLEFVSGVFELFSFYRTSHHEVVFATLTRPSN